MIAHLVTLASSVLVLRRTLSLARTGEYKVPGNETAGNAISSSHSLINGT